jgi:hypothetical protein
MIELHAIASQVGEGLLEVIEEHAVLLGLHDHIIHISMHIPPNLLLQTPLHGSLVSCSSVLQAKGHGDIAVGSVWVMEVLI